MAQLAAEKEAYNEAVWDSAHQENFDRDHAAAIAENEARERRLQAVGIDKLIIYTVTDKFDEWVSYADTPVFETQEALSAYCDLISRIKSSISCFEQAGKDLA